ATAELRDIYAELRTLASTTSDASTRAELRMLSDRMSASLRSADRQPDTEIRLSVREIDVLAQIALGCTNAVAAQRLSLGQETVKSYLRTAMNKTGAKTRHEAVVTARRRGLLP
ncbi:MAG: LuxR C-terminal-related transcriptional regulator, partial [Rhodococcus sp. (in: high G+C Gram-positive bacteria)]